jgi:alcohol dehydrogenase class IV
VNAFEYGLKTKVSFGVDRVRRLAEDVKEWSGDRRAVLITDPGLVRLGIADRIASLLTDGGVETVLFSNVESDPSSASVDAAAAVIREARARCVVGLGGGSAMDVAKLAALVAGAEHPAEHYALMANPFPRKRTVAIMIPTTSGTGAEVTSTVVFSTAEKRKVWGWDPQLAADLAVLDPVLTADLPPALTAATGLDALVHAIEAVTGRRSDPMIKAYGLQAVRLISANLPRALENPRDLEARGQLSVGSMLAGLAIEQGGTGIAHCIGHALGTLARIHHGRAVAAALYHAYAWNMEGHEPAFADIARAMNVPVAGGADEAEWAMAGCEFYRGLVERSGLDLSLRGDGLSVEDAPRLAEVMASAENEPMRSNNCRYASDEDLLRLAEALLAPQAAV